MLKVGNIPVPMLPLSLLVGSRSAGSGTVDTIDFTSAVLDSRVSFTGAAHLYFAEDGTLQTSSANVWPLEYSDGTAVGRHLPEPARTNLLPDSLFATGVWTKSSGSTWTTETTSLGTTGIIGAATNIYTSVYNSTTAAFVAADLDGGTGSDWATVSRVFTTAAGSLRWYVARQSSGLYLYGSIASAVAAGTYTASVQRMLDSSGMHCTLPQVELGGFYTSPIINTGSATGTRAAQSATITDTSKTSCVLTYSDSSTVTLTGTNGVFTIPTSTTNWGSKYLVSATLS